MNPRGLPWLGLAAASAAVGTLLSALGVPAAILIGPMLVAIAFGVGGVPLRMPRGAFVAAQGIVGCLVAASITPEVLGEVVRDWPGLAFGVVFTIAASTAIGWISARYGSLPGSTAAWGASPGAASAMVAMAQEYGADPRLVAAMQYIRVICVVLAASFVSRALMAAPPVPLPSHAPPPSAMPLALVATLAVALGGSWLGRRFRVPAGGLMVPLVLGALVNAATPLHLPVPSWLLLVAYTAIGWSIGLQFERTTLRRSLRALPEIVAAAIAIIVLCGLAAFAMVRVLGLDPLTAFLATSPGGIDTVAIIAVSGGADTPFVMALQTLRVLVVIATGPAIARFVARTAKRPG